MAIMALMDRVVDHCKNACCTRGFKRLFDGSFGGQKDARLKLWPTGKAVRGSSSSVGCLQSRAKSLDTAVSRLLRRLVWGEPLVSNQDFTCGAHANQAAWPLGLSAAPI